MRVNDKMLGGKDMTPHAHAHLVFVFRFTVNFIKVWLPAQNYEKDTHVYI